MRRRGCRSVAGGLAARDRPDGLLTVIGKIETKVEVWTFELRRKGRVDGVCDGVPRCPVERDVTGTLVEGNALVLELPVGENLEANGDDARQEDGRIDFGGNQGLPLGIGDPVDLVEIVLKINAPGVGKDLDAAAGAERMVEVRSGR